MWMHPRDCGDGGHKFEGRYDELPSGFQFGNSSGIEASELRELLVLRRYVHDICVHCGCVINRPRTE